MIKSELKEFIEARFKKIEGDYIVCDLKLGNSIKRKQMVDGKLKTITDKNIMEDVKIKLDLNNKDMIKKTKILKYKEKITLIFIRPPRIHHFDAKTYKLIEVLDEFDLLERRNRNALIKTHIPTREEFYRNKSISWKKNIKINELELENSQLKLQIQKLEKRIQELM